MLLGALFGIACSSAPPDAVTSDAGDNVHIDGGDVTDAGHVDSNVVVEESFESPAVASGASSDTLPEAIAVYAEGTDFAKVTRPTVDQLDTVAPLSSPAEGNQALMVQAANEVDLELRKLATARAGEKWVLEFALALPKTATEMAPFEPYFLADLSYYDSETSVETSSVALDDVKGKFKTVTVTWTVPAEADGTTLTSGIYFYSKAEGVPSQYLIDNVRVRRASSPDTMPIKPYEMHVWNASFEYAHPDPGGSWEPDWTTARWGWNIEKTNDAVGALMWRPDGTRVTQVEPLASPADALTLIDMGLKAPGSQPDQTVRLISTEFALAQEGKAYQVQVAVGRRMDLPLCSVNKVSIEQDGVAIGMTTVTNAAVPPGAFLDVSVQTTAIVSANAGKGLRAVISIEQPGGSNVELCRTMFDNVRTSVMAQAQ